MPDVPLPPALDLLAEESQSSLSSLSSHSKRKRNVQELQSNNLSPSDCQESNTSNCTRTRAIYANIDSSSSFVNDLEYNIGTRLYNDTSSTILNYNNELNSDAFSNIPSSPVFGEHLDNTIGRDPLRSDAFDDLVQLNNPDSELGLRPTIPSSPTLVPTQLSAASQSLQQPSQPQSFDKASAFQRPQLHKAVHCLSRHGSTFNEQPHKKKQRLYYKDDFPREHPMNRTSSSIPASLLHSSKIEFAIDREGHVYGYNLEKDELPTGYSPTLYDEPVYFVVKNTREAEIRVQRIIDDLMENENIDPKTGECLLDLKDLKLNSFPDSISDLQDFVSIINGNIVKPFIVIDAAINNLRSINPNMFKLERLRSITLRNNKIARLTGNIEKAQSLHTLNLGMNKLKFLPHNILKLNNLRVLAITGNPMIQPSSVDKIFNVNEKLLRLYCQEYRSTEFLDSDKQLKYFSRIHWLKSNLHISKGAAHASIMSRSLTTLQEMCDVEDLVEYKNIDMKFRMRLEQQKLIEKTTPWVPKLSEMALRQVSKYLISEYEVEKWKESTNEIIYKRAMNALVHGTNGETCGNCNENCIESVADMLEWWDFKGSRSVTIKRRFCCKHCAISWKKKLDKFKLVE